MLNEYYEKLLKQLSIDMNCASADFRVKENVITVSALNEGRRSYNPGMPFLQMVTLGRNTVIMADECLHEFLQALTKGVEGHRLFEFEYLKKLDLDDGIFELRCKQGSNITRVMYFFYVGKKIVATNGFVKKTQKTPAKELKLAKERRADWLSRHKEG